MTLRNGNNVGMLAILAAMGAGMGDGFGLPPMGAPRKRYVPQPVDHEAECRKFDDKVMKHRVTGEVRLVWWFPDLVSFDSYTTGKHFTRPHRKALDWIRNADVVGGES